MHIKWLDLNYTEEGARDTQVVKFTETESRMVFSRGGGRENGEFYFNRDSFSWGNENVLEMDDDDGYTSECA